MKSLYILIQRARRSNSSTLSLIIPVTQALPASGARILQSRQQDHSLPSLQLGDGLSFMVSFTKPPISDGCPHSNSHKLLFLYCFCDQFPDDFLPHHYPGTANPRESLPLLESLTTACVKLVMYTSCGSWLLKCDPQGSSISIAWVFIRNAES